MKIFFCCWSIFAGIGPAAFAAVTVTSPTNGQTVTSPVSYVASATTSTCSKGVASMGIYVDNVLKYVVNGAKLNTPMTLAQGAQHTVVEEWDYCGGATFTTLNITVSSTAGTTGATSVTVTSPAPNSTVHSPVTYAATATTTCAKGVASMGIYVDNKLTYVVSGAQLDHELSLNTGPEHTVVEEWDKCGGASYVTDNITVTTASLPSVQVTANPTSISQGSSSTLSVTAADATQVKISGSDGTSFTLGSTGGTQTVTPTASTTYEVTATSTTGSASAASLVQVTPPASAQLDYTRYKGDLAGTGANTNEILLTTQNVTAAHFGQKWNVKVDALVSAQPLYVHALTINGATHNVLYVATNNDTVYALDADSGSILWKRSFLSSGVTPVSLSSIGFGTFGILSTPVIDLASQAMYLVTWTSENSATYFPHRLNAISLKDGTNILAPVTISDPLMPPLYQFQRPALLLLNGTIYVGFGSVNDITPYHGLLFSFDEATLTQKAKWNDTQTGTEGGIWMAGAAPVVDSDGNIYLSTGNGTFNGTTDFGESAVKLSPDLNVLDYFAPTNNSTLSTNDLDLDSGGVVVVPDQPGAFPHELIACGKPTPIYVINRDDMGKVGSVTDNVIQRLDNAIGSTGSFRDSGQPCYSSPAIWNNNVYFAANHDTLKMFSINQTSGLLSLSSSSSTTYIWPGADPIISSNGSNNAIVWTLEFGSGTLHANDATDVSKSLYVSPSMGTIYGWVPPTVVNGYVYVGAYSSIVAYTNQ